MFASDKEIIFTLVASAFLMIFLIVIIVIAIVRYQNRMRMHFQEISEMKISFQKEILKIQNEIEEQTFQRISEEIHDNIGQILSLAKVNLNTLKLENNHPALKQINIINDLVSKAIQDLRQLSKSLNSAHLCNLSLADCIRTELDLIGRTGIYQTNICEYGSEKELEPQKQLVIFRIIQEVLNNIIKHAKANAINIVLEFKQKDIHISISDNGIGFNIEAYNLKNTMDKGSGIANIFRRANLISANIDFKSSQNFGTKILLEIPYN